MALFGIKMTKRRMSPLGSFHTEVEDVNSFFKRGTARKPLGLVRAFFSGLSLILGGMMCYVALHYIPAFLQTQKIFNSVTLEDAAIRLEDKGPIRKIFGPYIDAFSMQSTYLRSGHQIQAQFILPEGASLDLNIQQCRRVLVKEIFNCEGFAEEGFYHFDHKITFLNGIADDYKVVWIRK